MDIAMSWFLMAEMTPAERERYVDTALHGFITRQAATHRSRPTRTLRFRRRPVVSGITSA
jgi:hypothetical protein